MSQATSNLRTLRASGTGGRILIGGGSLFARALQLSGMCFSLLFLAAPLLAQTPAGEWTSWGGDLANTRYSPLDQITADNFDELEVAWRFSVRSLGPIPETYLQATPLVVNGVMYTTAGSRRDVVALNAATGEMLWLYREDEGRRGQVAPRDLSGRGLAYWSDGTGPNAEERIVYVTPGYRMIALDARTGRRVPSFGTDGVVDLKQEDDQEIEPLNPEIGLRSAPIIGRDTIVVGAAHNNGGIPAGRANVKGYVRGYDVRTGRRKWIFHTIPRPGEDGLETWLEDSWSYTGNTGAWGQFAVDEELGMVYVGTESPTGDYYGGPRPGDGLFGDSLLALDLETGERRWHYQFIHHGIWDHDNPCPPILADVMVEGRLTPIVAQCSKQAFLYVLNRETGEPVWPFEERPVEQGTVPGEWYAATQPFPTKPAPYDRHDFTAEELIDFTPQLRQEALELIKDYKIGPIFTPPVESKAEGPWATLTMATGRGGSNWPGASIDPETGILYVSSQAEASAIGLVPAGDRTDTGYISGRAPGARGPLTVRGLPLIKPPYGQISAIDLKTGDILWQVANGDTPDEIRNHPDLEGLEIPRTGRIGPVSTLVTKTLVVAGERGVVTMDDGKRGAMLRAYDKQTGEERGALYLPAPQTGGPMTYQIGGVQYLLIAVGGAFTDPEEAEFIVFRLPASAR